MKTLPFTEDELAQSLMGIYEGNKDASPWAPLYAKILNDLYPNVMSVQEWENRLRATGRQHHMHQERDLNGVRNPEWNLWYAHDFYTRYTEEKPLYDHIHVRLSRPEQPLEIIGQVRQALRDNSVSDAAIEQYTAESAQAELAEIRSIAGRYVELVT